MMPFRLMKRPWRAAFALLLVSAAAPGEMAAQARPYALADVLLWIQDGVREPRILQLVRRVCITPPLTPDVQQQLRDVGATDALIDGLLRICPPPQQPPIAINQPTQRPPVQPQPQTTTQRPPAQRPPPPPPPPSGGVIRRTGQQAGIPVRRESRYSRRALYPLYFDRPGVFTVYGAVMEPEWTGTESGTYEVEVPGGDTVTVQMPEAPVSIATYGISFGAADGLRLDLEAYLHDDAYPMLLFGPSLEPFLPIGRTHFRLILGVNGWMAVAGQRLPIVDEFSTESSDTLVVTSFGLGGDGRAGLAFHPKPGVWLFAEARYRWIGTMYRYTGDSSVEVVDEFPWDKLSIRGPSVRVGIGF